MKQCLSLSLLFFLLFNVDLKGQQDDSLFTRTRAIYNSGTHFFNVDGMEIASQSYTLDLSKKNVEKKLRQFSVKYEQLTPVDSLFGFPAKYFTRKEETAPGAITYTTYYVIENQQRQLSVISFASINKRDVEFEKWFVNLIRNNAIPKTIYESLTVDKINFAGREIQLGSACRWMGVNNMQCPYYGQMNWSLHKTLSGAIEAAGIQFKVVTMKPQVKIISQDSVDVVFEGVSTRAGRAVLDVKGLNSLLVGMTGGKTLTVYFVAAPVRQYFVSCVMSYWNNDKINSSGLPALVEEVMKLKQ
jgi:hypothetical protein